MIRNGYMPVTPVREGPIHPLTALDGYRRGLFPMGGSRESDAYAWFTHTPRGILPLYDLHISRSLKKELKKQPFEVTSDHAFENVITACAVGRDGNDERATWICEPVKNLFLDLHHMGHAHSIECWKEGELVGGLYGLHIGGVFFGESMFSIEPNASKIALVYLVGHLQKQGFLMLDTQQVNAHTKSMGAVEIGEFDYLIALQNTLILDAQWGQFHPHIPQTAPARQQGLRQNCDSGQEPIIPLHPT